ncbi:hypothetical protein NSQ38_03340 [Paenibacillus sp. FSL R7-0313]|uniref:hypothetical protein n=1 Tax=Paenibacillus sp. FSL R7-0313 TaxID=2954532 RepID=UPI0030D8E17C
MPPVISPAISEEVRVRLEQYLDEKFDKFLGNKGYVRVENFVLDVTRITASVLLRYKHDNGVFTTTDKFRITLDFDVFGSSRTEFCTTIFGQRACVSTDDLSFLSSLIPH